MMKTSLLRQAAATGVAFAVRPAHASFRASSAALALTRTSRPAAAVYRPASSLLRFYSSESAAPQTSDDGSSSLITRFADLPRLGVHDRLVNSLTSVLKYETMTDVQSMTINAALAGKDVVAQAKTGTGKTLAFLVPTVQRLIANQPELAYPRRGQARSDDIRAIILSPTRELAEQIGVEAKKLCQGTGVVVQTAVGGTQKNQMLRKTRIEGCHLMVATPGRLHDLLSDRSTGIDAPNLEALVLDEADRMLDVGFKTELESILNYLPHRTEVPRQTLLYSATIPKNVVNIARQFINPANFEFVQTVRADEVPTHERVPQFIVPCRGFENLVPTLLELTRREINKALNDPERLPFKAIVFLPTTASVQSYASIFRRLKYHDRAMPRIFDIHSKLAQSARTRSADDFRQSRSAILFSSDVSARGMDFPNVTHVIQVHLPQDRDLYIHRIGRTGRAGKQGEAYLLCADVEIPAARDRLPGLPIKRCSDLECAKMDVSRLTEVPQIFEDIQGAAAKIPFEVVKDTYTSLLGNAIKDVDKQDVVDELNNMVKYVYGMEEPPAVSSKMASQYGHHIRGLRVASGRDYTPRQEFGGRGGRGFGRGSGSDAFDRIERLASQDGGRRARRPPPPVF
ncbi:P-loop containing nucleoside triphosphate hydrolase protein [Corynascus novoguineensis]|uniref:ATP-dependent RNA helicase n=1 Tax=Corynascus novoguineensis TaxID=1126955 RepID=A0AAN7HIP1_9PEZI|nr:P-loop containing nucleoside triphosphate hydrolase protein [Corynascus novoguineensis]